MSHRRLMMNPGVEKRSICVWLLYCAINFCRFASPLISQLSGSQILNYLPPRAKNSCESTTSPWFHSWVIRFKERCTFWITYSKLTIFSHILPKPASWSRQFTQNTNLLLTEREGRTGEYWPEVVTVRTERSEVRTKTTEGQYSPVRPEQARLVSGLLYGTLFLIVNALPVGCT